MKKAVFLDRDGVLNKERGDYSWLPEHIIIPNDASDSLAKLKEAGYLLIVITNQGGIAKGIYKKEDVLTCFQIINDHVGNILDDHYYSPYHEVTTLCLGRKPGSLLFERAIGKYKIDVHQSWMVGDSERDLTASAKVGVRGILLGKNLGRIGLFAQNLTEAVDIILSDNS